MLCIVVPNQWTKFFSSVRTTQLSSRSRLVWLMQQRNAPSQNTAARKLQTLFQKYKLQLTTGIHACIGNVLCKNIYREFLKDATTADSLKNVAWKSDFTYFFLISVSIVIIPTCFLCQMEANSSGLWTLLLFSKFMKRMNFVIVCWQQRNVQKVWCTCKVVVLPCQATAYLTSRCRCILYFLDYLRYIVICQKQNILGANLIAPTDSIPNVFLTHR